MRGTMRHVCVFCTRPGKGKYTVRVERENPCTRACILRTYTIVLVESYRVACGLYSAGRQFGMIFKEAGDSANGGKMVPTGGGLLAEMVWRGQVNDAQNWTFAWHYHGIVMGVYSSTCMAWPSTKVLLWGCNKGPCQGHSNLMAHVMAHPRACAFTGGRGRAVNARPSSITIHYNGTIIRLLWHCRR